MLQAKKSREEVREARRTEASHSVYVHGFSDDTTEEQLRSLFSAAGHIDRVFMDTNKRVTLTNSSASNRLYLKGCDLNTCRSDYFNDYTFLSSDE